MSPGGASLSGRQPKAVQSALRVLEEVARSGVGVTAKDLSDRRTFRRRRSTGC